MPSRFAESVSPLVVVDSKGKVIALESPSSKLKKKRKLVKASEGEPKRSKFMSCAMHEVETVETVIESYPTLALRGLDP